MHGLRQAAGRLRARRRRQGRAAARDSLASASPWLKAMAAVAAGPLGASASPV